MPVFRSLRGIDEGAASPRLARQGITRCTSPRNARGTARIISRTARVPSRSRSGSTRSISELDGPPFEELSKDGSWVWWNMHAARRPAGWRNHASGSDRIVRYLNRVRAAHTGGRIALVTHAEVIRAAVMHCRGLSLDAYAEVRLRPRLSWR